MAQQQPATGFGRDTQSTIYRGGAGGRKPAVPTVAGPLADAARSAMSAEAWAYVAGSSGSETTASANRNALDRWQILPRVLRNVATRDLGVELFGHRYPSPVLAAPVGALELVHPESDLAVARATAELGIPYIFSSQASRSMEETAAVMGDSPRWFQLYWSSSDDLVASLLHRAEAVGPGHRHHPRHPHARLAPAGPRPRLPALHPRHRYRPVHERPGVPSHGARPRRTARHGPEAARDGRRHPHARRHDPPLPGRLRRKPAVR